MSPKRTHSNLEIEPVYIFFFCHSPTFLSSPLIFSLPSSSPQVSRSFCFAASFDSLDFCENNDSAVQCLILEYSRICQGRFHDSSFRINERQYQNEDYLLLTHARMKRLLTRRIKTLALAAPGIFSTSSVLYLSKPMIVCTSEEAAMGGGESLRVFFRLEEVCVVDLIKAEDWSCISDDD